MAIFSLAALVSAAQRWGRAAWDALIAAARWLFGTSDGRQVALAAAVVLAFWWSGQRGFERGQGACEAAHRAAAAAEVQRQAQIVAHIILTSEIRTRLSFEAATRDRSAVDKIKEIAHADPNAAHPCIGPDLADRLRALAQ